MRVFVGDTRLDRLEPSSESQSVSETGHTGYWLFDDLHLLTKRTTDIVRDEVSSYEPVRVRFSGLIIYLELEPLSKDGLRVAARISGDHDEANVTVPESNACGYAVSREAFAEAVLDVGDRFLAKADEFGVPSDETLRAEFETAHDDLKRAVQSKNGSQSG